MGESRTDVMCNDTHALMLRTLYLSAYYDSF